MKNKFKYLRVGVGLKNLYYRSFVSSFFLVGMCLFLLMACEDNNEIEEEEPDGTVVITPDSGMDLYGYIGDDEGNPVVGVVVSDGYSCTKTNSEGIYQMKKNTSASFVFYSTPSGYEVNTESESVNMASFYSKIGSNERFDFELIKLGSVENDFTLVCIGDPQVTSSTTIDRFKNETISDLNAFTESWAKPCYALSMGDVVGDKPLLLDQMKIHLGSINMPVFTTIGNHDKVETSDADEPRVSYVFSNIFGPLDYSFNRGNVHFVCLDNIIFSNSSTYSGGFSDEQVAWLKEDLSYVSKDKMVIVYYHIPIRGSSAIENSDEILSALSGFAEVHLMCGHTHYNENYIHTSPIEVYEHVHAAACGSWWHSTINGDGTPNGYAIYEISGASIVDWYYKPVGYSYDFQMRLHNGDKAFGGLYGYYTYDQGDNTIVANVWNADDNWKVEAFEDGVKVADLTPLSKTMKDAWALGYHIGVLNRDPDNYSPACKHLYSYTIKNTEATIEIRATDPFGNVYSQGEVVVNFESAASY